MLNSVLILAPHTDDAELGCGGSIAKFVEEGKTVFVAVFSTAEDSLPVGMPSDTLKREFCNAMPILGVPPSNLIIYDFQVRRLSYHRQEVLDEMVALKSRLKPELVLLPSGNDLHQDHQVVYAEGLRAFKEISLMGYELPWNHINFSAQAFITLEKKHVNMKWEALQCYTSQLTLDRLYLKRDFIEGIAKVRGVQIKSEWAEAFEVFRFKF